MKSRHLFWSCAVPVLRRRFAALFVAAAWPYWALVSLFILARIVVRPLLPVDAAYDPITMWRDLSVFAKFGVIMAFVATSSIPPGLAIAGVSWLTYRECLGLRTSFRDTLSQIRRQLLSLLILSFCIGCAEVFGSFLLVLGIFVAVLTVFAVPVLLLEGSGITTAVRRSTRLASDRIGTLFTLLLTMIVVLIVLQVLIAPVVLGVNPSDDALAVGFWGFLALIVPTVLCVYGTFVTVLYHDIRVARGELSFPTDSQQPSPEVPTPDA